MIRSLHLVISLSCMALLACNQSRVIQPAAPPPAPSARAQSAAEGTQHGGGGHKVALTSTREQVHRAIDIALEELKDTFKDGYVSGFFSVSNDDASLSEREKEVQAKVYNLRGAKDGHLLAEYFFKSKIVRQENGDCGDPSLKHADASVSEMKWGADICISIENMRKTPPDVLIRQTVALLLHEAVHLNGYGEEDAIALQTRAYKSFGAKFSAEQAAAVREQAPRVFHEMRGKLEAAAALNRKQPGDQGVYIIIGQAVQMFMTPFNLGHVFFDLVQPPRNPDLYGVCTNAALNLFDKFEKLGFHLWGNPGPKFPANPDLQTHLDAAIADARTVETNWRAFTRGDTRPVCVDVPNVSDPDLKLARDKCEAVVRAWPAQGEK